MDSKNAVIENVMFAFPLDIQKQIVEAGEFHVVGYAATTDFDLQGDVITEEALRSSSLDLIKNSTVLLNHEIKNPIGRVTKAEFDQHGLLIDVLISKTEPDVIQKIKEGVLNKFSIRGQVLEREKKYMPELDRVVNVIKRMSLVEVSLVSVPANPEARAIGWYISKALEQSDAQRKGGQHMPQEEMIEKISGDETPPANKGTETPAPDANPNPSETKPETTPNPEPNKPETPPPAGDEVKKQNGMMAHMDLVWSLLDRLVGLGGDAAEIAQQVKTLLNLILGNASPAMSAKGKSPESKPQFSKDEIGEMISTEVKKQVEPLLKNLPAMRKGLIQPEVEADQVKKTFEGLPPEKKLKVALALQQS